VNPSGWRIRKLRKKRGSKKDKQDLMSIVGAAVGER